VLEKDTGVSIYVGPWVLSLALLEEDVGNDLVKLGDELEELVVGKVLESEFSLAGVSGISLSENSVTVARDDSTTLERVPDEVSELLIGNFVGAKVGDKLSEPDKDFLVGKTVKRSSQTVQSGGEGKVRVRKSRADQVRSVGGDVATFVIGVNGEVKSHKLNEFGIIESDHVAVVGGPVKAGVSGGKVTVLAVEIVENLSGDGRKVGNAVHAIFVDIFPVGGLVNTLGVSLGELGLGVHESNSGGELGHWVDILGEVIEHLSDVRWEASSLVPLVGERLSLLGGWNFAGNKEPEKSFGKRFATFDGGWKKILAFGDGLASESDTLVSIKDGGLPDHSLDTTHTTISHINCHISKRIAAMIFSEFLDLGDLAGDLGSNDFLQIRGGSSTSLRSEKRCGGSSQCHSN